MIDHFTREQFEAALYPALWNPLGLVDGEYCYHLICRNKQVRILCRSSVGPNGWSADAGEDSIRLILQTNCGNPLDPHNPYEWQSIGKGPDAYTTRQPGWQARLVKKIWEVKAKAALIQYPLQPGERVFYVKQDGPNKGRPFAKRNEQFRWLDQ